MFWAILISVWGGFLLGVIFMAILSMAREEERAGTSEQHRPEGIPAKATPLPSAERKMKAMHG